MAWKKKYARKLKKFSSMSKSLKRKRPSTSRSSHPKRKFARTSRSSRTGLQRQPKLTGTKHWLSFGKGVKNRKRVGFLKNMEKILNPNIQMVNSSGVMSSTAGIQSWYVVQELYGFADITLQNLGGGNDENKSLLKDGLAKTFFTNQSNAPCFIDLYTCVARRDLNTGDNTGTRKIDPVSLMNSSSYIGSSSSSDIGASLFDSMEFTTHFKVTSVTRINLALGETCEHILKSTPQRIWNHAIDYSDLILTTSAKTADANYKNLTQYTVACIVGCPVDADNTTVDTAVAKVDFVTSVRYCYSQIGTSISAVGYTNNIGTVAGHVMDTGTGTDVAVASA